MSSLKPPLSLGVITAATTFVMKFIILLVVTVLSAHAPQQKHTPLPHGMIFGARPSNINMIPANKLEAYVGKRARTYAVVVGKVIRVTKPKGGWFEVDAGNGNIIQAYFENYQVNLPEDLKGREVIMDGIAAKHFIADDRQHMAGDTVVGKKQHQVKTNPKRRLYFAVKGLMVNK
jgi:hypothetical protein